MNLYARIGMYLFIIGAMVSILDGVFTGHSAAQGIVYIVLIFTGIFAALLNISEDEEHHFLLSAAAFIIVIVAFNQLFAGEPVIDTLRRFLLNAVTFVGSMAAAIAVKSILEFGSQNYLVDPKEGMDLRTAEIESWMLTKRVRAWHFIVFLAVALTFILLLLGMPFYTVPESFQSFFDLLGWVVVAVFMADLFVLWKEHRGLKDFLRHCWVDVVAALPLQLLFAIPSFGVLKIVRVARVARLARLTRATHSIKFFSKKSGVNTYLRTAEHRTEPKEIAEHPVVEQKRSAKKKR